MAQYDLNLRDYHRILRRRWKVVVFATILVGFFSYLFGRSRLPLYETFSSVKIEETNTVAGILVQRLTYTRWDNIATAQELVRSFPVMEEVAKRMGLIDAKLTSDEIQHDIKLSSLVNRMIYKVNAERSGKTNIIDIHVTLDNPYEAREIAQTLAEIFAQKQQEMQSRQDRETREFIEEQLRLASADLSNAESELQVFMEKNPYPVEVDHVNQKLARLDELIDNQRDFRERIRALDMQRDQMLLRLEPSRFDSLKKYGSFADRFGKYRVEYRDSLLGNLDWINASESSGALGLLNNRLLLLEGQKQDLLQKYKPSFPKVADTEKQIRSLIHELIEEIQGSKTLLQKKVDSLNVYIKETQRALDGVPQAQRMYAWLKREVKIKEDQYSFLSQQLQEAMIREADKADEVVVVRPAMLNTKPININMFRTTSVGVIIGLMLGLVLAFLFETFDTSIGTIEDVEEFLQVPVMGVIPHIDLEAVAERLIEQNPQLEENPNVISSARLVTHFAPKDPVAEAYRSLRTALQFRSISRPIKTIVATSAALQEGKSTTLVNLAITMAQGGSRVLLVGCNLRRPTLYKIFGLEQSPGVTDIVLGRRDWQTIIRTVTDIIMGDMGMESILMTPGMENLHIITSGSVPPNPSEMLASENMKQFIMEAREEFDIVLFDVPPILPVTDAAVLANRTDATLLIYRAGKVPRAVLKRAKVQIEAVGATVLGIVLNDLKADLAGYAGTHYYYGRYYGKPEQLGRLAVPVDGKGNSSFWSRMLNRLAELPLIGNVRGERRQI